MIITQFPTESSIRISGWSNVLKGHYFSGLLTICPATTAIARNGWHSVTRRCIQNGRIIVNALLVWHIVVYPFELNPGKMGPQRKWQFEALIIPQLVSYCSGASGKIYMGYRVTSVCQLNGKEASCAAVVRPSSTVNAIDVDRVKGKRTRKIERIVDSSKTRRNRKTSWQKYSSTGFSSCACIISWLPR